MTTGAPCAVRMRSLICAFTSVSPATCAKWAGHLSGEHQAQQARTIYA